MQKWELHLNDVKIHFKLIFWDCKILSEKLCRSFLCHRADLIQITRLFSVHSSPFLAMLRRTKQTKTPLGSKSTCHNAQGSLHPHQTTRVMPEHVPTGSLGEQTLQKAPHPQNTARSMLRSQHNPLWESLMCLWTPETSWTWGTPHPNKPKGGSSPSISKYWPFVMSSLAQVAGECGEGNGTPLQYSCLENPINGGAWWATVHGVAKSRTGLSDFTFTFHFPALEKEVATHSSVLAWRIPGTGEPGGLPSMGLHRVGHDWSDLAVAAGDSDGKESAC